MKANRLRHYGCALLERGLDAPIKPPAPKIYTVSRCRNDDTLYGPVHWSSDGDVTFCGSDMTETKGYTDQRF